MKVSNIIAYLSLNSIDIYWSFKCYIIYKMPYNCYKPKCWPFTFQIHVNYCNDWIKMYLFWFPTYLSSYNIYLQVLIHTSRPDDMAIKCYSHWWPPNVVHDCMWSKQLYASGWENVPYCNGNLNMTQICAIYSPTTKMMLSSAKFSIWVKI